MALIPPGAARFPLSRDYVRYLFAIAAVLRLLVEVLLDRILSCTFLSEKDKVVVFTLVTKFRVLPLPAKFFPAENEETSFEA